MLSVHVSTKRSVAIPGAISRVAPAKSCKKVAPSKSLRTSIVSKAVATDSGPTVAEAAANNEHLGTFNTWLFRQEAAGIIDSELAVVLSSVATACKQISSLVSRSGISGMTGLAGAENIQGEDQKKLDVISNDIFCNTLRSSGRTGVIASEEEDLPVAVENTFSGNYVVVFDPLDGSSNIDAGISVGSIFGVYNPNEECEVGDLDGPEGMMKKCVADVCQPGNCLQCAGYVLYSSSTMLVLTIGTGVVGFTLDPLVGEFVLTHDNIKIPDTGKIYSFNEGNYGLWDKPVQKYMDSLKDAEKWGGKPYSARYIGSLVGDFHRTLLYGGIYGYPGDTLNANGKLRLLYECAPMSFIAEQAGGKGSTGKMRVMDVDPDEVHQRVPLFVGSKGEVEYLESFTLDK